MRTSKIKSLIKIVEESNIDELEVSHWGSRVLIRKKVRQIGDNNGHNPQVKAAIPDKLIEITPGQAAEIKPEPAPVKAENRLEIKTPMVGTFYRAPSPDAKPYVQVGDRITRGQIICIIEAMKIMNEIESEYDGIVVEVLAQNAQPVQFGQPLLAIEPA
ncbi:MAG: acetyl-CoA carboxylase biotin carboxyl carrier protein [candidate division Zixibacteria bacterium]|nr:acetyl-CoA carboxylase biotin carboxyl carrier protein [candidate division Zixibacteria bacterium]